MAETTLKIIEILLENGSYPHARNKKGLCPGDGLPHLKLHRFNPEDLIKQFKDMIAKYDSKMTLKYLAAKEIINSKAPYEDKLPKDLIKFVSLH